MESVLLLLIFVAGVYGAVKLTTIVNYWTFGENQERRDKAKKAEKENASIVKDEE